MFVAMDTISALKRLKRTPRAFGEAFWDKRLLAHRPGHYYSPVPPFDELLALPLPAGGVAGVTVAGGGDTVSALNRAGVTDRFTYVSTAGGAFLEWLEGKALPGVEVLRAK